MKNRTMSKAYLFTIFSFLLLSTLLCAQEPVNVSMSGNAYVTSGESIRIGNKDLSGWKDASTVVSVWFKVTNTGNIGISVRAKTDGKKSVINLSSQGQTFPVELQSEEFSVKPAGTIRVDSPGYIRVDLQGVNREGDIFAEVSDLIISGSAIAEPIYYVRDFSTYWGRRGPSVHMGYTLPEEDIEYFYNEVTVPEGNDVIGSYFMANGFEGGYFGIQVNSPTERRVLFSVWSPYETQDPKDIPEEYRIVKLRQGEGVHIGEFGNEGSGGQSYLKYNWKAGQTYKFLTHIRPDGKGNTLFTAYFYATDENRWRLIASFLRPKTDTWYKRAHSFLENFIPAQGYLTRKVQFTNQWAVTTKGRWIEVTQGGFTNDATARAKVRQDYGGGYDESVNGFYLQNGGFFNDNTEFGATFHRKAENKKPKINLKSLHKIKDNE